MRSFAPGKLRAHLSSRVGACGRRPLESADPGVRRVAAFGAESNAGLGLGKLYGGRGPRWTPHANFAMQNRWFYDGKMKDLVVGTCLAPNGSPSGSQNRPRSSTEHILGAPEELLGSFGRPFLVENRSAGVQVAPCLLYTSPSPRDGLLSRMPSSA